MWLVVAELDTRGWDHVRYERYATDQQDKTKRKIHYFLLSRFSFLL